MLTLASCSQRAKQLPIGEALNESEKSKILTTLLTARDAVQSYRALYRVVLYEGETRTIMRYALLAEPRGNLRLDILPISGVYTLGLFTVVDGKALALDPGNKRSFRSEDSGRAIRLSTGLGVSAPELLAIALGTLPVGVNTQSVSLEKSHGALVLKATEGLQEWNIDPIDLHIKRVELRRREKQPPVATVEYQSFIKDGGINLPQTFVISKPRDNSRVELTLISHTLNVAIPAEKFMLVVPDDYSEWVGLSEGE